MKNLCSFAFTAFFALTVPHFQPQLTLNLPDYEVTNVALTCSEVDSKFTVTISNIGQGRPNRRVSVVLRGKNDNTKKCLALTAQRDVDVIRPGKNAVLEFPLKNNCNCNAPLMVEVIVDPDFVIQESDRSNNKKVSSFN